MHNIRQTHCAKMKISRQTNKLSNMLKIRQAGRPKWQSIFNCFKNKTAQNADKGDELERRLKTMWAGMQICNMPPQGGRQVVIAEQVRKQTA
jgi:hypothetical protein